MKISHLSAFIIGLLLTGFVHAQAAETVPQIKLISAETIEDDARTIHIAEDNLTIPEKGEHFGKMEGREKHSECPMKKMMGDHYRKGGMILFKLLHVLGMFIFLFFGAAVVAKGWKFGMKECCKKKK